MSKMDKMTKADKIRETLRLSYECKQPHRLIGESCNMSSSTVGSYLERFRLSGLTWPLPEALNDQTLVKLLFRGQGAPRIDRPVPDWVAVQQELRKKHVTLHLLWKEYRDLHPDGYEYSWFCQAYGAWRSKIDPIMRQEYRAGERCFVDYAGQKMYVICNTQTGEVREAEVFVAVLGASNYTYAEAHWSQDLESWVGAHIRMFRFFGSVPEILVCDNLKSGVLKPDYYEPELNPTYAKMAEHYGVAILPARVRRPRDKAKVEGAVRIVEQSVLAPLRRAEFYSLVELNERISEGMFEMNVRRFQKLPGCRRSVFLEQEKPAMRPLPNEPFMIGEWKRAKVHIDYHIEVEGAYYSVPYRFMGEVVEIFLTCAVLEITHSGVRVAVHRRIPRGHTSTVKDHMPPRHRKMTEWTPERIAAWASKTGAATETMVTTIMSQRAHPEQGFRACLGVLRLGTKYGAERLEAACQRALAGKAHSFKSVKSILEKGLDQQQLPSATPAPRPGDYHENIRGAEYYQEEEPTE